MIVYVHGGVAGVARSQSTDLSPAVRRALRETTALNAVEAALIELEDHAGLNAGRSSVLNRDGELELDAGIADGATGTFGGVANVTVRNPVCLARRVLEQTPHVLMTGDGAKKLGSDMETIAPSEEQSGRWREARESGGLDRVFGMDEHVDTVGAVALDPLKRTAAASSTGGVFGQLAGRVGDAAVMGAGVYASNSVGVVGTGVGELFLETLACLRVAELVAEGAAPQEACERVIGYLGTHADFPAGLLALDARGRMGAAFRGGSWSVHGPSGRLTPVTLQ